jgi:hypothetical protein
MTRTLQEMVADVPMVEAAAMDAASVDRESSAATPVETEPMPLPRVYADMEDSRLDRMIRTLELVKQSNDADAARKAPSAKRGILVAIGSAVASFALVRFFRRQFGKR